MRPLLLLLTLILSQSLVLGQIVYDSTNINTSVTKQTLVLEDKEHALTVEDVLSIDDSEFTQPTHDIEILDFNSSRWFVKFSITNNTNDFAFTLELARPITNKVYLHEVKNGKVIQTYKGGDDTPLDEKAVNHRLNLFKLFFDKGQTRHFIAELESDGEVITLPVRLWTDEAFNEKDYDSQMRHGFYYGLLTLVSIIYFFFFITLRDRSFLYYVIYVFFQILLQFSLDGYSYHYLFPSNAYLANHSVLIGAGGAVIFILLYAKEFLKTAKRSPLLNKIFKVFMGLVLLITVGSLIPGPTYEFAFPVINAVSLISTLYIIFAIFKLKRKGESVCNFFTAAFIILISGVVVFILGNFHIVGDAEISQAALKWSSALEVLALSMSMANKYRELQAAKEKAQAKALESLQEKNALMDEMNVRLEKQVKERTHQIELQKQELAEKNQEVTSSIRYAQRIQSAILPSDSKIKNMFPKSFVLYKPRDIVSGDFYFFESTVVTSDNKEIDGKELKLVAAVDCTGHGVPGAMVSVVGNNYLKQSLKQENVNSPAEALDFLNQGVAKTLNENKEATIRDGMDMSLIALSPSNDKLTFAGAKNPVYVVRKRKNEEVDAKARNPFYNPDTDFILTEYKGDKHPIGDYGGDELLPFSNQEVALEKDDMIYMFSDGYADQFGGERGKKMNYKRFKQLLTEICHLDTDKQFEILEERFEEWKGDVEQVDDVLVIGIRI